MARPNAESLATPLSWALAYAEIGWHVLPIEPGEKRPLGRLVPQGVNDATNDLQLIRSWWMRHPGAGVGIALAKSGLVAIDVDPRNGGTETFDELQADHGSLRSEVMAFTGGGGEHHVFVIPHGAHIQLPGTLGAGVDLKCNGYIVVEPSLHPSGKAYQWEASSSPLDGVAPTPLPDWLRGLAAPSRPFHRDDRGRVVTGGRNEHLSRKAFALRKAGLALAHIDDVLQRINSDECSPPLDADEVRQIAHRKTIVEADPLVYLGGAVSVPVDSTQGLVLTVEELHKVAGDLSWACKGIIPEHSLGFVYGASGTFKSFIALDYALHRAYGMPWMGRKTKRGIPVYLAAEGGAGLMKRIIAWHKDRGMNWQDCPMRVVIVPLTLRTQSGVLREAIEATGIAPSDVIVDTFSQAFTGNENSNDEVADWLRTVGTELRDALRCVVLVVHHSGHSATERPRGASAIIANIDFALGVYRDEEQLLARVEFAKIKDGERPDEASFELARQELGFDGDGDTISSLSARYVASAEEKAEILQREAKNGRSGRVALILTLAQQGMPEAELRKAFYDECGLSDADSRRQAYFRARKWATQEAQVFEIVEGRVVLSRDKRA